MGYGKSEVNYKRNKKSATKADLILETDMEILEKLGRLSDEIKKTNERISSMSGRDESDYASRQITEVHNSLQSEIDSLKQELKYLAAQNESIFLSVRKQMEALVSAVGGGAAVAVAEQPPRAEIDYDLLAEKVAQMLPVQEYVSPDYIASKIAEQIVIPEYPAPQYSSAEQAEEYRPAEQPVPVDIQLDEDDLADRIALKVGGIKAEDFDILVDDDGCASISKEIAENLNYDVISSAISEKLRSMLEYITDRDTDYDEVASRIGDKIKVAGINEDAIAEKAAAVLSEYIPEIDSDEIADKIAAQLISVLHSGATEAETASASEETAQADNDYNIVIDEEGLGLITGQVTEEVNRTTGERFDRVEKEIAELKAMITAGALREVAASSAAEESYVAEESLVTVSDLMEGEEGEETAEEYEDLSKLVDEINTEEEPLEEPADGVDFENMMKYNRSFIARIIQSTDEQKQYYGSVKTALLSYARVNSNVAWGAERFNKGRETIARFKIRGKTLCLYLALNPTDYPYSVYHQTDVSGNKSLHNTPFMVKIKSPRGVKKAIRLIDDMLQQRGAVKRNKVLERDYAAMYPYETTEELIEDGLIKDVNK